MSRDYVWMQVIGVLGETLVMYSFFDALLPAPPRTRKFRPWMAYLLFAAAFFTLKMITDNSIAGMLGFLLLAFAVSMVYAGNWKNKFALSVLLFLISGLSEMGVGMVLALQAPGSVANMKSDTLFYFQGMFISKLVELIIVKVIGRFRNKHVYALKLRTWFGIMLIPITNIIITYELYDIAYQSSDMRNKLRLFFIFLCMLATTAVAFHLFENELKIVERNVRLDMLEKQIANEQAYYKDIARTQTELQKTAHDMKNALLAVLGTVSDGNAPAAEGKLRDMLQVATDNLQTVYTGRATVDAMLNVKARRMREKHIRFEPICFLRKEMALDDIDFCIFLGNALDNAIEACEKLPEEKRYIQLKLLESDGTLSCSIENPTDGALPENGARTTKRDRRRHGFGLENMREIVRKNGGEMETRSADGKFVLLAVFLL